MNDTPNTPSSPKPDDAMLTAFALGELAPDSDVYKQVQARLETDADARTFVEQTSALGQQLSASYAANNAAASGLLDHQQKELSAMIDQQDNTPSGPITPPKRFWLSRPALIAAGLALAAGAAITTITLMDGPDKPTIQHADASALTGLDKIGKSLAEPVAVDFENAPLSEVLAFLNKQTRVAIDTDWNALAKRGINAKTPITLKADELIPASRVLTAALQTAWSQSQHPDPAQWMMTDQGITVAPQSALLDARLQATAALLKSNRLSKAVLDEKVLTADRAEVWESDLWNQVLAQRGEAAVAVLAEADAAFDSAESAIATDDLDRAASKTMYAYQLISANNTLLASDQFDKPAERFESLRKTITAGQRQADDAALAKVLEEAKKRYAAEDDEETKERLITAREYFKKAAAISQQGDADAAVALFERAMLLDPENADYGVRYAETRAKLAETMQPLALLNRSRGEEKLDQLTNSLSKVEAKLSKPAVSLPPNNSPRPSGMALGPGGNENNLFAGKAGKKKEGRADNNFYFSSSEQAQGRTTLKSADGAPVSPVFGAGSHKSLEVFDAPTDASERGKGRKYLERDLKSQSVYRSRESLRRSAGYISDLGRIDTDKEGRLLSRRVQLQAQLDHLVKEKPLPQLDEDAKAQHQAISIALNDAIELEPFELKRKAQVQKLDLLNERFHEGCMEAFEMDPQLSRDAFALVNDNPFYNPADAGRAMSTFSVDVDTAAYTIARRQLMERNQLPTPGAVRIEEMINYFDYNYEAPTVDAAALQDGVVTQASLEAFEKKDKDFAPFATHLQVTDCPWQAGNQLVRIGIKGMEVAQKDRPSAHLTFLLDVSGSMNRPNKLGLVKDSLKLLLDKLNDQDHVSIVVYAGASGIVLENAPATNRLAIEQALDKLRAGGSTAGAAGIQLAYKTAQKHYIDGGINRVILCTDGDFNVGISGTDALVDLIKEKANPQADDDGKRRGVYLSVMGYGMGNLNDAMMEPLTNAGNGTYAYIDTLKEATKVMYDQAGSNLVTIAKDVKVQVHFDASQVMAYRLIGYENRVLANVDFDNDKVDAGDIGAGHSVTALYEIVPFPSEDDFGGEGFFEVNHRIDELERAVTLNQAMMQTVSLSPKQSMKLAASTRMLEQEIMLANAVAKKIKQDKPANAELDVDVKAATPDDIAHEAASEERFDDGAMLAVKLRYKPVDAPAEDGTSRLITSRVFADEAVAFEAADESTRFAASVASFAMQLRSSPHAGNVDLDWVLDTAEAASSHDPSQLRREMIEIVKKAKTLMPKPAAGNDAPGADAL